MLTTNRQRHLFLDIPTTKPQKIPASIQAADDNFLKNGTRQNVQNFPFSVIKRHFIEYFSFIFFLISY
jgi:hypothetical protein